MSNTGKSGKISRRKFIVRSVLGGTGVILGITYLARNPIRRKIATYLNTGEGLYLGNTEDPAIWFQIMEDNSVVLCSPKVEMGQGTFTGLAQIASDELEIDIAKIIVKHVETASGNIDRFATGGSTSISGLWQPLRELSATMREMLKGVAAKKLGEDINSLTVENGVIISGEKSITYGEAVKDVTEWEIPEVPVLKELKAYKFIGKPIPRVDLEEKVLGTPLFGMDASMPNMVYGAIVKPSSIGATFVSADTSAAAQMPGVLKVVQKEDFVGVVAKSRTEAENAKEAIKVSWETTKNWQSKDIEDMILVGKGTPYLIQTEGNAEDILEEEGVITASYKSPIGAHAQLEPNGAVAYVEANKATILVATQVIDFTRMQIAKRLGLDKEQVNIKPTFLGGGFGRRLYTPTAEYAAVLSQAVGKPVKCFLNRQEEFQNDYFRPPTHHVLKGKLGENGKIIALEHNVSSGDVMYGSPLVPKVTSSVLGADLGAWRGGMIQYGKIPHFRAVSWRVKLPFATCWWRSLGLLANTFAIESFMDELAIRAKVDPVQFRLDQIQDDDTGYRLKEVIKAAAKKAAWKDGVHKGRAMGFAASTDASTPVAQIAEVSVVGKEIKVHKVTCVIDPGIAVNPDQVKAQCEGAIIMGLSASMYEKMYVKDGALQPIIYGPYKMAQIKHTPKEIDVVILENAPEPGAVGEPPLGPIGAAIANAVFRITGQRLRNMPLALT